MTNIVKYLAEKFILSIVHHLGNISVISCTEAATRSVDVEKPHQAVTVYSNLLRTTE